MKTLAFIVVLLGSLAVSDVFYDAVMNVDSDDFVSIEIVSVDTIEITIDKNGATLRKRISIGKTVDVIEAENESYDVFIYVRKISDGGNAIFVTITDQDSNVLLRQVYLESKFTLDLKGIAG